MRVVSLNLDQGDATVIRRAIKQALDRCGCSSMSGRMPCPDCRALAVALSDLDRLVHEPAIGRPPLLTLVAVNGGANHELHPDDPDVDALEDSDRLRLLIRDEGGRSNR